MKGINYRCKGIDPSFMKIKNIILLGFIMISFIIFHYYLKERIILELLKIMITFLGILFGFFMVSLIRWSEVYEKLYDKNIDVLKTQIRNINSEYACSIPELMKIAKEMAKTDGNIKKLFSPINLIGEFNGKVKKSSWAIIICLIIFVIGSLFFIAIGENILTKIQIFLFSCLFGLFLYILQEILVISMHIHFPKLKSFLSN